MSLPALRQQIATIERRGFFGVDDARKLVSTPTIGRRVSIEEHAVLIVFQDRVVDKRVRSSPQARAVLDKVVAKGPTGAMADGAAVAMGAAKSGLKIGVVGALLGGVAAAIGSAMTGDFGPFAQIAAQNSVVTGVGVGGAFGFGIGAIKGAVQTKRERD